MRAGQHSAARGIAGEQRAKRPETAARIVRAIAGRAIRGDNGKLPACVNLQGLAERDAMPRGQFAQTRGKGGFPRVPLLQG